MEMAKHYNNERAGHADNDSLNGLWDICSMTYLKVELPRDLPRTDCFRRASACSPMQFLRLKPFICPGLLMMKEARKKHGSNADPEIRYR